MKRQTLWIGILLGLTALEVGWRLLERGLVYGDEYAFVEQTDWLQYRDAKGWMPLNILADSIHFTTKPVFMLFLRLTFAITGGMFHASLILSAIMMVLAVWLTFAIGRRLFGPWGGWWAAALLALSPYALLYARSGFAQTSGTALLLVAILRFVQGKGPGQVGMLLGAAFCTHYSTGIFALGILILELLGFFKGVSGFQVISRSLRLCLGWWMWPILFEAAWRLNRKLYPAASFGEGFFHFLIQNPQIAASGGNPWAGAYVFYLWQLQGVLFSLALLLSLTVLGLSLLWKNRPSWVLPLWVLTVLPLAWWSVGPPNGQMIRTMAAALPLMCLSVAGGIVWVGLKVRPVLTHLLVVVFVVGFTVQSSPRRTQIIHWRSEFTQLLRENRFHPLGSVLITSQIGTWGLARPPQLVQVGWRGYPESGKTVFYHSEIEDEALSVVKHFGITHALVCQTNLWRFPTLLEDAQRVRTYTNLERQFPLGNFEAMFTPEQWFYYARLAKGTDPNWVRSLRLFGKFFPFPEELEGTRRDHEPNVYLYRFTHPIVSE